MADTRRGFRFSSSGSRPSSELESEHQTPPSTQPESELTRLGSTPKSSLHVSETAEGSSSRSKRLRVPTLVELKKDWPKGSGGRLLFRRLPSGELMETPGISSNCLGGLRTHAEYVWEPEDEMEVKKMWESKARTRYSDTLSDIKSKLKTKSDAGLPMKRPLGMSEDFWTGIKAYWAQEDVEKISHQARANRLSEPDGPGTGISKHVGGSQSTRILQQSLSLESGLPVTALNYETFIRIHTKEDGSYATPRDEKLDAKIHRIAAEIGREDLNEIYLEIVHPMRSRRYSTGSAGASQVNRGSTSSTGTSAAALSQEMSRTRISTLEERLQKAEEDRAAERATHEELEQRMAMFEQFMLQSGQLPPRPPPT